LHALSPTSTLFPYTTLFRSSPFRVSAIVLRYLYLLRGSWPRKLELIYWPTMQMTLWGFLNQFLATNSHWVAQASGVLISAVLLRSEEHTSELQSRFDLVCRL